jgi:ubiquinone/menaquinone biosynthesis C-methylase UbiE
MATERRIDPLAQAFDGIAEEYERGRLEYPADAVDWAWAQLGLGAGGTVVDLAAGTGKLTRRLTGRGARVIAVEPLAGMREVLRRAVPDADVEDGTAEEIPLADASAAAVFVAEAFHWFDGDRALAEIHRVLQASGGLAIVYGSSDWDSLPWNDDLRVVYEQLDQPLVTRENRPWTGHWREALDRSRLFGEVTSRTFTAHGRPTVDDVLRLQSTWSWVAAMSPPERAELERRVLAVFAAHGIESFDLPLTTTVYLTHRVGA